MWFCLPDNVIAGPLPDVPEVKALGNVLCLLVVALHVHAMTVVRRNGCYCIGPPAPDNLCERAALKTRIQAIVAGHGLLYSDYYLRTLEPDS